MGSGGRIGLPSKKSQRAYAAERARQAKLRAERAKARQAIKDERDKWIKSYRMRTGEYGWGLLGWPFQWWHEKRAWEEEWESRERMRRSGGVPDANMETELRGLIDSEGGGSTGRENGVGEGVGSVRKRKGRDVK